MEEEIDIEEECGITAKQLDPDENKEIYPEFPDDEHYNLDEILLIFLFDGNR